MRAFCLTSPSFLNIVQIDSLTDCRVSANLPSHTFAFIFMKDEQLLLVVYDLLLFADDEGLLLIVDSERGEYISIEDCSSFTFL